MDIQFRGCDFAASLAEAREPSEIALRAAREEVERLFHLTGTQLDDARFYRIALGVQRSLNRRAVRRGDHSRIILPEGREEN